MTATIATTVSEAFVASITQSRDLASRGIDAWADLAAKAPARPSFGSLPFAGLLPDPTEAVESTFGVVDALVESQKQIATKLLEAVGSKDS